MKKKNFFLPQLQMFLFRNKYLIVRSHVGKGKKEREISLSIFFFCWEKLFLVYVSFFFLLCLIYLLHSVHDVNNYLRTYMYTYMCSMDVCISGKVVRYIHFRTTLVTSLWDVNGMCLFFTRHTTTSECPLADG